MSAQNINVLFDYDWELDVPFTDIRAVVRIDGDDAEVMFLDVDDPRIDELTVDWMKRLEDRAIHLAFLKITD